MTAVTVRVGPVDPEHARTWVTHELRNVEILRANGEKLPFLVPDEIVEEIVSYLREWEFVAASDRPFRWTAKVDRDRLELLVRYWANLDLMTDELVERLGLEWAPLSTRPFFDALVAGVDAALRSDAGVPHPFAQILAR